ncbi:unnamed protein product [Triticum turgidum subsp. durum]|uniref:Uncharacterized protein n=1 Tax=Triticum turgidum subsp. durum TaxID=4567 RepID=A0A9R0XUG9_TRITD|nr:unnamed protein product [Triticum turgidum subsp. durum]
MGSEPAAEIIPAETTTDTTVEEVDVEREPAAAATDTMLSVTTLPNVISTKETGVTSGMVDDHKLMKSEPAAEASPAAIATDTTADEVDVESEPAENFDSPVPSPTDAISTGESVQVDGGQHDDEQGKYFANTKDAKYFANTKDAKYFAKKHGLSAQVTDRMNKGSSKEEMEGMAGLEGQQMEDATKLGCLVEPLDIVLSISDALMVDSQVLGVPDNYGYGEPSPEVDGVVLISLS